MTQYAIYPSLKDKVVFITGGGSGIGATLVEHFCEQEARVHFVDIAEEPSRQLVEAIAGRGLPAPRFLHADLRDIETLQRHIRAAATDSGGLHVMVNNAAHDERHSVESVTVDYWEDRMHVNLRHQFFSAQAALPFMREAGGGSIINMGSSSWHIGQGGMPGYTTAKAGIEGLTRGLARDFGPYGIRVNCVIPGWIITERQRRLWLTPEGEKELMEKQCLKAQLKPEDVSRMVLWLGADDSRMCTSQNYVVDGGWI